MRAYPGFSPARYILDAWEITPMPSSYGPGTAVPVPVPRLPHLTPLLAHWLVTNPRHHPERHQWVIAAVSLADFPGFKPPRPAFPGATCEVMIVPLRADGHQPHTAATLARALATGDAAWHCNGVISVHVRAAEDHIREALARIAGAVAEGKWNPDITPDPAALHRKWTEAVCRLLHQVRQKTTEGEPG